MDWTSLFSFRPWTWLMAESHFLYFWLSWTTGLVGLWTPGGSLRCWALDPWWITEVLGSVYRGPKKWASTATLSEVTPPWCGHMLKREARTPQPILY